MLGVSLDDEQNHKKFSEKYHLSFPLLVDADMAISKSYEVYKKKSFLGKSYMGIERTTFIIGRDRKIIKIFRNVKPEGHSKEVLRVLDGLR